MRPMTVARRASVCVSLGMFMLASTRLADQDTEPPTTPTGMSRTLAAAHNGLGAAKMALGDNDGALAALSAAVKLDDRDPNPQRNLELLRSRTSVR